MEALRAPQSNPRRDTRGMEDWLSQPDLQSPAELAYGPRQRQPGLGRHEASALVDSIGGQQR